ncbi:AbiTii domain-containing protein [Lysinibacillus fusiformis]|uniref:AbiTii domain-containing protein n=1 Tax=Lysinibacillus fusiformis TaxID=28031 RepID=UPI001244D571|nr:hypothetical protein [Lysinibacillus fusiformis]KAB0443276.1 hypothetical protein CH314_06460 [Lysinibacillus fusiformis]
MGSLVLELQREAYQNDTTISQLIRKAFVLARKLEVKELSEWLNKEMEGYKEVNIKEVPTYRHVEGNLKAWNPYLGRFIPAIVEGETAQELSTYSLLQPISEIESLIEGAKNGEGILQYTFPSAMQLKFMKSSRVKLEVSLHIPVSQFENIPNRVRDIILDWTLSLEEKGVLGENMTFNSDEKKSANQITNIYNQIGAMINSPLQQNSNNSSQTVSVGEFKVEILKEIVEQGKLLLEQITDEDTKAELKSELTVLEAQAESPKPKKAIIKESLASIRNIAEGATGSVLVSLVPKLVEVLSTL